MDIQIKRVYDEASESDGYRVLVDRLWPRGVRKDALPLDEWAKDVTPSTELRKEWHSGAISDEVFGQKYRAELEGNPGVSRLAEIAKQRRLTLLVATRKMDTSHAHVLESAIRTV